MDYGIIGGVELGWRIIQHSIVGPFSLTLAIVTGYGLLMKSVWAQTVGGDTPSEIFHAVVGLLSIAVSVVLLYLWSVALDLSFLCAVLVWFVAVAGGCANLYITRQQGRAVVPDARRVAA